MSLFSKRQKREMQEEFEQEFFSHVDALLMKKEVQMLDGCVQHYNYTRLRHSIEVAYLSFCIAKRFGLDSRAAARAGLLHDLFFEEDMADCKRPWHAHPHVALENARKVCDLTPMEEDIIVKHMWLVTKAPPKYAEGYVVTFVDKFCALREFMVSMFSSKPLYSMFEM